MQKRATHAVLQPAQTQCCDQLLADGRQQRLSQKSSTPAAKMLLAQTSCDQEPAAVLLLAQSSCDQVQAVGGRRQIQKRCLEGSGSGGLLGLRQTRAMIQPAQTQCCDQLPAEGSGGRTGEGSDIATESALPAQN
jgi:hypothetical protein